MRLRAAIAALFLIVPAVHATTIVLPTDDQLITKSPVIVTGKVIDSTPVDQNGSIYTVTRVAVEQSLKGQAPSTIEIREVGGRIGDRINVVFGSPEYHAGEQVLLFLWPTGRGDYQTRDLFVGKFSQRFTKNGDRLWFRETQANGTHLLDAQLQAIEPRNIQRLADKFTHYVSERAAGRMANRDYVVENPSLARVPEKKANFLLIDEPTIYRWTAFDNGGSANWYSVGTQPSFPGGGINEVSAAMNAWNSAPGARIRYVYSGVSSSAPGGLDHPNGVNEILFDDPRGEIDGTYNPAVGGVVGRGGFNNVSSGGSWTPGYAADASHPGTPYASTWRIVEGNLVIQDGVTTWNGFGPALLGAVIAHEFGHTLGFGHSADPAALMYASLNSGQSASLRTDDQNAARWLYPSTSSGGGGGTPPPPPPPTGPPLSPSNLTAVAQQNGSSILLNWKVNASNASSQGIYVASGIQAPFQYIDSVEATRTFALLNNVVSGITYRIRVTAKNSSGESNPSNIAQVTIPVQLPASVLGLNGTRFRLTLSARDQRSGKTGTGRSIPHNDLFGYFSIPDLTGNASNPEVFVKLLNADAVNGKYWVFWGGLTDLEYTLTVTDSATGISRSYQKEAGSTCGGYDTAAFDAPANVDFEPALPAPGPLELVTEADLNAAACTSSTGGLCLSASRFRLTLTARDQRTGTTAPGQALPRTDLFGYFSIPGLTGDEGNPEVFVKMLDARAVNGHYWIFYSGLTDLEYTLTVTDMTNGSVKTYVKSGANSCGAFDTEAF